MVGMAKMLRFSIKNVFRKRGITILASTGIGVGLMLMLVLGAFSAGVKAQFDENFSKLAGVVEVTQANRQGWQSNMPLDTVQKLLNANFGSDIRKHNVFFEMSTDYVLLYSDKLSLAGNRLSITGLNIGIDKEWEGSTTKIIEGRMFNPGAREIIIDSRLKDVAEFDVNVGKTFTLYLNGTLLGEKVDVNIVGVYQQDDSGAPDFVPRSYFMYMDINVAWEIATEAENPSNFYTKIDLRFPGESNEQTQGYVDAIKQLSNDGYFGIAITAFSLTGFQDALEETFSLFDSFITIISLITAIAGGMGIIVSQLMSVMERMKEFAILKSTGWKNSDVFKNIVYESLTMGVLGAAIGITLGSVLIFVLNSGVGPFGGAAQAIVTPLLVIQVLAFALGIGLVGGIYPALKASRVRPVIVLKGD
jgi:putative ABC transport system permease protein